jgi:hypothetical protein
LQVYPEAIQLSRGALTWPPPSERKRQYADYYLPSSIWTHTQHSEMTIRLRATMFML